ncbi:NAD-dependent epimerase/dehydratase family protein [Bordetella genomosp. 6]|uniref:NAD-dependent epimerase/dehydratase family protein n=1 Tax=Bordetella genomosp. 6 TaxID=463024 RepID=UPI000A28E9C9|nr:NAD-dependent epimerase/dehydratase family protein [Bordetella genomosp. 6]ARP75794.1 NAD(P)-dependent oxidoreductase [Bordetella genomosp. 6]
MSERVLLAGCGDLGARVARRLLARGDQVWALRRQPPPAEEGGPRWIAADLTQPATLAGLPGGLTQVVYLPAPGARDPARYREVFVDGLRHLRGALDTTALRRTLFVSSSAVYGEHDGQWVDEHTPAGPLGFNGRTLLDAERSLDAWPGQTVVLRLAGLYGPGRLQLLERLRAGQARAPVDPPHWANRIHIDDAAAAIAHLLRLPAPDPLYLGCDDTPLPLHELYAALAALAGAPPPGDGPAPPQVGSKRLCNARLRASGLRLQWPDSRTGYAALLDGAAAPHTTIHTTTKRSIP